MDAGVLLGWFIDHLDYWVIILFMAIESSFIPFPSEVVVPPAAFFAAAGLVSGMNIPMIIVAATVGAIIGSLINYGLALWLGKPIVYGFANSRWGHACLLNEEKVKKAEMFFNDHGAVATLTGRLIPAVRQLISIPAGLAKMPMGKFLLYTTIGAGAWNTVLALIGYYLYSSNVLQIESDDPAAYKEALLKKVSEYSGEITIIILGLLGLVVVFFLAKWLIKKKSSK